ncbi:MAG: MarR family transcriptional regulator [Thermoplasmata archaeon]|nr:MarR family transcriptional regulator [Thermoplasmata archaeon]
MPDPTEAASARKEFLGSLEAMMMTHMKSQREVLRSHGLTVPQFIVLIWVNREGPTTLSSLAQLLEVTPQSITSIVDALEGSGWIARSTVPTDRRASLVALTPTGTKLLGTIRASQTERVERGLASQSADALRSAAQVMEAVRSSLAPSTAPTSEDP